MKNIITPLNTIAINDDTRKCIDTLISKYGIDTAINFVESLSGFNKSQAMSFVKLMTSIDL